MTAQMKIGWKQVLIVALVFSFLTPGFSYFQLRMHHVKNADEFGGRKKTLTTQLNSKFFQLLRLIN